jgi:tetratricopeptide (TPR) repeat protein
MFDQAPATAELWWQKPEWVTGLSTAVGALLAGVFGLLELLNKRRERQLRICKAEDLDPGDIVGGFRAKGCTEYLPIPADAEILPALLEGGSVGLQGRPGIGKSHTAVQAIRQLGLSAHAGRHNVVWWIQKLLCTLRIPGFAQARDWYVIRPPRQTLLVASQLRIRKRRYVLLLDDINDYARDDEGTAVLDLLDTLQSQAREFIVVSTLRVTTPEIESVQSISKIFGRWKWIDLADWSYAQGNMLAQKCGTGLDKWDGTPLSVKQPSSEMQNNYKALKSGSQAKAVIRCLALLKNYGIDPVPRSFLETLCASAIFNIPLSQFEAALSTVNGIGFLKSAGQFVAAYGPYLDTVDDWSPDAPRNYAVLRDLLVAERRLDEMIDVAARWYGLCKYDEAERICRRCLEFAPRAPFCHYWLGLVLRRMGDLKGSETEFRAAVYFNPQYDRARSMLAHILLLQGRNDEAERCYAAVLRTAPKMIEAHIGMGAVLLDRHDYAGAASRFQEALELNPNSARAHCFLAETLYYLGRKEEASNSYKRAVELGPKLLETHIGYSRFLCENDEFGAATREAEEAIRIAPDSAWAHSLLGEALLGLRELDDSEREYRKAISFDPDFHDAYIGLGIVLLEKKNYIDARDVFAKAVGLQPNAARSHSFLGEALSQLNQLSQAEASYLAAVELDPQMPEPYTGLGRVLLRKPDYIGAEDAFRNALRLKGDNAWIYSRLGEALRLEGKLDEAEQAYNKSLLLDKNIFYSQMGLGLIHRIRNEGPEAEARFRDALAIDPTSVQAYSALAPILIAQQKWEDLRAIEANILKVESKKPITYFGPGMSAIRSQDWNTAVSNFQKVIELEPKRARAYQHLGDALLHLGRAGEAVNALKEAVRLSQKMSKAYYLLGKALFANGDLPEAEAALRESIKIKPSFGEVHEVLGETLERLDRLVEAIDSYTAALSLNPELAEAKSRLQALEQRSVTG